MNDLAPCVRCHTFSDSLRKSMCTRCYSKDRYDTDPEYRAKAEKNRDAWYAKKKIEDPGYLRDRGSRSARRPGTRYSGSKSLAKRRGLEFSIEKVDYFRLLTLPCFYCSGPLPETSIGLDRVDNSKGYSYDNVVACCKECNRLKGSVYTLEETKVMIKALKEYRNDN